MIEFVLTIVLLFTAAAFTVETLGFLFPHLTRKVRIEVVLNLGAIYGAIALAHYIGGTP